jgi:regulator of replication initiation timing
MPKEKKSAKTKSSKLNKVKADVTAVIETSKKLELQLKKVRKDLSHYPYNPVYGGPRC